MLWNTIKFIWDRVIAVFVAKAVLLIFKIIKNPMPLIRFMLPILFIYAGYLTFKAPPSGTKTTTMSQTETVKKTESPQPPERKPLVSSFVSKGSTSNEYSREGVSLSSSPPVLPIKPLPEKRKELLISADFDMVFPVWDDRFYLPPSTGQSFALVCTTLRPTGQDFDGFWSRLLLRYFTLPTLEEERYFGDQVERIQSELTTPQSWSNRAVMSRQYPVFLIMDFPSATPLLINAVPRLPVQPSACLDLFGYYGFHRYYLKLTFSYQ